MASKVKTPMVDKKKGKAAKKPVLEGGEDLGAARQPDVDEGEVLSVEGMSADDTVHEEDGGPETSTGSSSGSSAATSITHADLERIIEEGQTKIGKWLLAQQDVTWDKRLKNIENASAKLLDIKLNGLRKELQESIDTRVDARLTASEAGFEAMIATANKAAADAKDLVGKVQKQVNKDEAGAQYRGGTAPTSSSSTLSWTPRPLEIKGFCAYDRRYAEGEPGVRRQLR